MFHNDYCLSKGRKVIRRLTAIRINKYAIQYIPYTRSVNFFKLSNKHQNERKILSWLDFFLNHWFGVEKKQHYFPHYASSSWLSALFLTSYTVKNTVFIRLFTVELYSLWPSNLLRWNCNIITIESLYTIIWPSINTQFGPLNIKFDPFFYNEVANKWP